MFGLLRFLLYISLRNQLNGVTLMRKKLLVIAFVALTGCYQKINPSLIHTYSVEQLCLGAAASVNGDAPLLELVKRNILTESDATLVKQMTIRAGMPECALLAMKGLPRPPAYCGTINSSGGISGSQKQYVYRPCGNNNTRTTYVYVKSGIITNWQNW